ncbi:MAG TPA: class I SAM-dependent methyltransferase [Acidobacteriaceae bacterium]|nr:class I SAM-dependent methyltransferase [Acidobacteriaceae bacterium]
MNSIGARGPYQGVLQILQFNRPYYVGAALTVLVAMLALPFLHSAWRIALIVSVVPALFWLASSLIVSHYVYDRFPLYDLRWIARALGRTPAKWINIHNGFDETSGLLSAIFPQSQACVVDIYDPKVMTEGSIRMAQGRKSGEIPSVSAQYDALPFNSGSFDAVFVIFAAHELRRHDQRVTLFRELARILAPGRDLILMEHSRDLWNFLAFGPGAFHFFSRSVWRKAILQAGLTLRTEFPMTRFVRVYHLQKLA